MHPNPQHFFKAFLKYSGNLSEWNERGSVFMHDLMNELCTSSFHLEKPGSTERMKPWCLISPVLCSRAEHILTIPSRKRHFFVKAFLKYSEFFKKIKKKLVHLWPHEWTFHLQFCWKNLFSTWTHCPFTDFSDIETKKALIVQCGWVMNVYFVQWCEESVCPLLICICHI